MVLAKPTGTISGDLIIAAVLTDYFSGVWTMPAGWAQTARVWDSTTGMMLTVFSKVAGASEAATYTFQTTGSASYEGVMASYSGAAAAAPIEVSATGAASTGTTLTAPAVTTVTASDELIFAYATWSATSLTAGGSQTQRVNAGAFGDLIAISDAAATGTGAQATRTYTQSPTGRWCTITLGVKPFAAGAPYTLSGRGIHAVTAGTNALRITINTLPAIAGAGSANPVNYYDVGLLRPSDGTGYWDAIPITGGPQWVKVPAGTIQMGYYLFGNAQVTIEELTAVP